MKNKSNLMAGIFCLVVVLALPAKQMWVNLLTTFAGFLNLVIFIANNYNKNKQ